MRLCIPALTARASLDSAGAKVRVKMLKLIIILIITIILAYLLFTVLKKVMKLALFTGLVIIIFLMITAIAYPQTNILKKGKDYIVGKSDAMIEEGKDYIVGKADDAIEEGKNKVIGYVILETNQTVNRAREKILDNLELD